MTSDTSCFSGYVQAHEIQRYRDDYDMMERMKSLEGVRVSMRMSVKAYGIIQKVYSGRVGLVG